MKKQLNLFALGSAALMAISVFMPWLSTSISASFGGFGGNASAGLAGTHSFDGIIGLLISLAAAFFAFKEIKWSPVAGIVNVLIGICHALGWVGSDYSGGGFNFDSGSGSSSVSVSTGFGLYIFIAAAIVFTVTTIKYLKNGGEFDLKDLGKSLEQASQSIATQVTQSTTLKPSPGFQPFAGKITSAKAFLFDTPSINNSTRDFIPQSELIHIEKEFESFYYGSYNNPNGEKLIGWVLKIDVIKIG